MMQLIAILILNLTLTLIIVTSPSTTQGKLNFLFLLNSIFLLGVIFGWNQVVSLTNHLNNFSFQDKVVKEVKKLGKEAKEIGKENRRIIEKYTTN